MVDPDTGRYYGGRQDRKDLSKKDRRNIDRKIGEGEEVPGGMKHRRKKGKKPFIVEWRYVGPEVEEPEENHRKWWFMQKHNREWTHDWGRHEKLRGARQSHQQGLKSSFWWRDRDPEHYEYRIRNTKTNEIFSAKEED